VHRVGTVALCGALATAGALSLMRWSDRRDARVWAQRPVRLHASLVIQFPRLPYGPWSRPVTAAEHAAVIRQVIPPQRNHHPQDHL